MSSQKHAVLVVDDEPIHARFVRAVLEPAGWHVDEATGGEAGVAAIRSGKYALVLMDIQMPGLDGLAGTALVRGDGGMAATVPILGFTAIRSPDLIDRLREAGMDGHLAKPCTPEALLAAVMPWLPLEPHPGARLAAIFGASEVEDLLASFRNNLVDALETLNRPETSAAERCMIAHRIAGLAGTLGFASVSESWLRVSEGDDSAADVARIAARKALALLDRTSALDPR